MANPRAVLVVDDDKAMGEMVVSLLGDHGIDGEWVGGAAAAVEAVGRRDFDAVLSDIRMPGRSGVELLGELRELRPDLPVVLMTAFGSIDSAVEAMRAGAFHYVTKPFKREEVLVVLERAFEHRELERENARLRRAVERTASFGGTSASPGAIAPSSRSTARRSRKACSRASSSATRRAPSPAPTRTSRACSSARTAGRCSSTRSGTWAATCRASCCACSRTAR